MLRLTGRVAESLAVVVVFLKLSGHPLASINRFLTNLLRLELHNMIYLLGSARGIQHGFLITETLNFELAYLLPRIDPVHIKCMVKGMAANVC